MKYIKIVSCILLLLLTHNLRAQKKEDFERKVKQAVRCQMNTYPASTLKDLYKNFFQDKYGPGHLISNPEAAGNSLKRELDSMGISDGELLEPTGWEGNFFRVNLSLIKDQIIPYEIYFDAFVRSVNGIQPIPVEKWKEEWMEIEAIIHTLEPGLPDYETDKVVILQHLEQGEYVAHHSEIFECTYSPHYRIISRAILEEELLPLIKRYMTSQQNDL